jgi:hypothetical protein
MNTAKNVGKKILYIVLIVVVLAVLYTVFIKPDATTDSPLASTDDGTEVALTEEDSVTNEAFLNTLLNLRGISLDESIFASNEFGTLQDFTITLIQPGTHGRPNPFAPIGSDDSSLSGVETIMTLPAANISSSSAVFNGSLISTLVPTERWFEWGTTTAPSTRTPSIVTASAPFTTTLSGLTPLSTYYYKAAAKAGGVLYYGPVVSFKTPVAPAQSSDPN